MSPIDSNDPRPWYRFHGIFSSFLRRRLLQLPGDELAQINRLACAWFEGRGLYAEAIRHARYAGDEARVADLVAAVARPLLYGGQFLQLLRWASDLPLSAWRGRVDVLLSIAWSQLIARRSGDIEETLRAIDAHLADGASEVAVLEATLVRALHYLMQDDTAQAITPLRPVLAHPPETGGYNLLMLGAVSGNALVGAGDYERARDLAADCQGRMRKLHGMRPRPYLDSVAGLSFLVQGDFVQARDVLMRIVRDLEREHGFAHHAAAHIAAYLAEAAYQLDDPEGVEDHLDAYAESFDVLGLPNCSLYALRAKARLHFRKGDLPRALAALDELERLAQDEGWDRLAAWSLAERVRMLGRESGSITAMREALRRLRRLAARYPDAAAGTLAEVRLAQAIAEVDAAYAERELDRAIMLALPLAEDLGQRGRMHLGARLKVIAAIALMDCGRLDEALVLGAAACCCSRSIAVCADCCPKRAGPVCAWLRACVPQWICEPKSGSCSTPFSTTRWILPSHRWPLSRRQVHRPRPESLHRLRERIPCPLKSARSCSCSAVH